MSEAEPPRPRFNPFLPIWCVAPIPFVLLGAYLVSSKQVSNPIFALFLMFGPAIITLVLTFGLYRKWQPNEDLRYRAAMDTWSRSFFCQSCGGTFQLDLAHEYGNGLHT
jgi:hypothetical protein